MRSISGADDADTCDTCGRPGIDFRRRAGDRVCERCDSVFTAAHALLDNDVRDEADIVGTLAFAWGKGDWSADLHDYGVLELSGAADGVPVLRLPRVMAGVLTYEGSRVARAVKIDVYARVEREEAAETYRRVLEEHGIHHDQFTAGDFAVDAEGASLTLTVRAKKELHPARVPLLEAYPPGRIYSFPPPAVVGGFYGVLLGSADKRTFSGFAHALAVEGKHTPPKAVAGSVAWLLGESDDAVPPRERRPRIAKPLNKHLLAPRDEPGLPEGHWTPDDTVWRDASRLGPRLMRVLYHLQESRMQPFP